MKKCNLLRLWIRNDKSVTDIPPLIFEVKYENKHYLINFQDNDIIELNDGLIVKVMKDYYVLKSVVLSIVLAQIHNDTIKAKYKDEKDKIVKIVVP